MAGIEVLQQLLELVTSLSAVQQEMQVSNSLVTKEVVTLKQALKQLQKEVREGPQVEQPLLAGQASSSLLADQVATMTKEVATLKQQLHQHQPNIEASQPKVHGLDSSDAPQVLTTEVGSSAWECTLLVAVPGTGILGMLTLIFMVCLNICMQMTFSFVTIYSFANSDSITAWPDKAKQWRIESAHRYDLMDQNSWVSLADKVCQLDQSLNFATAQYSILNQIRPYIEPIEGMNVTFGQVLSFLVLLTWTLLCASELKDTINFLVAVLKIPRRITSLVVSEGGIVLESIDIFTFSLTVASNVCRVAVVAMLGISGSRWLAATADMESLVLNAAALTFVFGVDEMIFGTFAPGTTRTVLAQLEPLHMFSWKGIEVSRILSFLVSAVWLGFVWHEYASPIQEVLERIEEEMCGRHKHFVVDIQASYGFAILSPTNLYASENTNSGSMAASGDTDSLIRKVIKDSISNATLIQNYAHIDNPQLGAVLVSSRTELTQLQDAPLDRFTPKCSDHDDGARVVQDEHAYWLAIKYMIQEFYDQLLEHNTCPGATDWCNKKEMNLLRFLCPDTCGCGDPRSGLLHLEGCPSVCRQDRDVHLQATSCQDINPISGFISFGQYPGFEAFEGLNKELLEEIGFTQLPEPLYNTCASAADIWSPEFLSPVTQYNGVLPCLSNEQRSSVRAFCPVSCGCTEMLNNGEQAYDCPPSCKKGAGALANFPCSQGLCRDGTLPREDRSAGEYFGEYFTCESLHDYLRTEYSDYDTDIDLCIDFRIEFSERCCYVVEGT